MNRHGLRWRSAGAFTVLLLGLTGGLAHAGQDTAPAAPPATAPALKIESSLPVLPVWARVDHPLRYRVVSEFQSNGVVVKLAATFVQTLKRIESRLTIWDANWEDCAMLLDGETYPYPPKSTGSLTRRVTGQVESAAEGMPLIDMDRMFLAAVFVPPTETLKAGQTVEIRDEYPETAKFRSITRTITFEGTDQVAEKSGFVVLVRLKEAGSGFESSTKYWITPDGLVQKFESKVTGLPVPSMGVTLDGTLKSELIAP